MARGRRAPIDLPPGPRRELVDLLRRLAHAAELDNASVARSAGLSPSYVSEMFNGRKAPAPDTAARLVAVLKASGPDEMLARRLAEQLQEHKQYERARPPSPGRRTAEPPDSWSTYLAFLGALDAAHNGLRGIARGDLPGDLLGSANAVMEETGVYTQRDRLLTSGGPPVVAAGEAAFFALVEVRNVIRTGRSLDSPAYHDAYHVFADKLWGYRLAVRGELGRQPLSPADVHRADWSDRDRCAACDTSVPDADGAQAGPVERTQVGVRVPHPALRDPQRPGGGHAVPHQAGEGGADVGGRDAAHPADARYDGAGAAE
jgi:hypothetical protein